MRRGQYSKDVAPVDGPGAMFMLLVGGWTVMLFGLLSAWTGQTLWPFTSQWLLVIAAGCLISGLVGNAVLRR